MIDVSSNICTITNLWDIFATTYTEGDIDRKVKVGDVPNCAVKLQAGNIILSLKILSIPKVNLMSIQRIVIRMVIIRISFVRKRSK